MRRLLCIGECMLELSATPDGLFREGFAGDTFNTAWYARRIAGGGTDVAFLSPVGDDDASARLEAFVRASGVTPLLGKRPGRGIGLYMIWLTNGERSFSYWRDSSAARTLADNLDDLPGLAAGDLAYFSGITLAVLPPESRERFLRAVRAARGAGVRIAFDPNIRPRLWPDADRMRAVLMEAAAAADIVLPSFGDEAMHFGDRSPMDCARRYLGAGASTVAVKNGPDPVLVMQHGSVVTVTPEPVPDPIDTTAAGDAFNAAFLLALDAGEGAEGAALAGCRLSARVIRHRGALAPV